MALLDRLTAEGPKRILALDGGGVRGGLALGFLGKIEAVLRQRYGDPSLTLSDYFDLIGGTSVGAITASALSMGMSMSDCAEFMLTLSREAFKKRRAKIWEAKYREEPLLNLLDRMFGSRQLDDESLRTGLCIIAKRADTNSTWPLINHPSGKYFQENRKILLRDAVHASTAAPLAFAPVGMELTPGHSATFVDGGISMAKNPALQLFLVATLEGYRFTWPTGADHLLLVSIGTGRWDYTVDAQAMAKDRAWDWMCHVPRMLMADAATQNELLLQFLSRSPTAREIDSEIGNLDGDVLGQDPALRYLRYDVRLDANRLKELGMGDLVCRLDRLRQMSCAEHAEDMVRIGEAEAAQQVKEEHFPAAFDIRSRA